MKNWMTKKNIFIVSGIATALLLLWDYIGNYQLCGKVWGDCITTLANIEILFSPIIPIFFFSLLTYKLQEEVFRAWLIFVYWFTPPWVLLVALVPSSGGGLVPIDKGRITFGMNIIFVLISLVLIAYKSFALRKRG